MSTIETPPLNRLPVETVVCGYDERIICDSINREIERQGQVYFLHNRVQSIEKMRDRIAELCPQAQRRRTHRVRRPGRTSQLGPGRRRRPPLDVGSTGRTLFTKTALMINAEHPSTMQTTVRPALRRSENAIVWSNTYMPQQWYAGGPSRRKLETIAVNAFRAVRRQHVPRSEPAAAGRRSRRLLPRRAGRRHERVLPLLPHRRRKRRTRCRGPASRRPRAPTRRSSTR